MELDFTSLNEAYSHYEQIFNHLLETAIEELHITSNLVVSCTIIDDEMIHQFNRDYRNIDRATDVLSFAFLDGEENREKLLKEDSDLDVILGDIYISYEHAIEQAKIYEHSEEREFSFLFVHGLLHLLGYDHMRPEDEEIMFPLQEKILLKEIENRNDK